MAFALAGSGQQQRHLEGAGDQGACLHPLHARHALVGFAQDLGLAYQITGDLQDAEAGKACGKTGDGRTGGRAKDKARGKANYVAVLGAPAARERLGLLAAQTKAHLDPFGERAVYLRDCVDFVMEQRA